MAQENQTASLRFSISFLRVLSQMPGASKLVRLHSVHNWMSFLASLPLHTHPIQLDLVDSAF